MPRLSRNQIVYMIRSFGTALDLQGQDLHGLDLSGLDLSGAKLQGANLDGANLGRKFPKLRTVLNGAYLEGASLRGVIDLPRGLVDAHAAGADFSNARAYQGDWRGSDFQGANLAGLEFLNSVDWSGANLIGANLRGLKSTNGVLKLIDTKLIGANLQESILHYGDLTDADLTDADLRDADLKNCRMKGTILSRAKYNRRTIWPSSSFVPSMVGAIMME